MPHPFHISNLIPQRNIAADGIYTYDLAVNPLSVVLINLRPLNDTGTLAQWPNAFQIAKAINRLTILYRGEAIKSMRGEDCLAMNFFRWGMSPFLGNPDNVNNERRCMTLPVIMGRYPFQAASCFPAVNKGELTLELDLDIADTGYDTLDISIDTIELPGAKPKEYEKCVQQGLTFSATGNNDVDLPVGNLMRGFLLWGTTGFDGATPAPSWGNVSVLLDNQESGFRTLDVEVAATLQMLWGRLPLPSSEDDHMHTTTVDGNAGTAVETLGGGGYTRATTYRQYAFLDYDPDGQDTFALDTTNARRLQIRANVETADAVRCIPIERIKV